MKKEVGLGYGKMVKLDLKYGLPFCIVTLSYKGRDILIDNVLLDTGSGHTLVTKLHSNGSHMSYDKE